MAGNNSASRPSLLACVQDYTNPLSDCYLVKADPKNDVLVVERREAGSSTVLDQTTVTIDEGVEYQLGLRLVEGTVKGFISSKHGRKIATTGAITDQTYNKGYFGFYTGGGSGSTAPAYYDYVQGSPASKSTAAEVSEEQSGGQDALNTTLADEVLSELNNPSTDTNNTTRVNSYNGKFRGHTIKVPIEYGSMFVSYSRSSSSPDEVIADLDRSTMPDSLVQDLSDNVGWPTSESGILYNSNECDTPYFSRTLTDSEQTDCENTVGRNDKPVGTAVWNNNGGKYRLHYHDKTYHVSEDRTTVDEEADQLRSTSECRDLSGSCLIDILSFGVGCAPAQLACAIAKASAPLTGPVGPVGVCITAALAFCGPSLALFSFGSCPEFVDECL